jgi:protein-S-isoprenylcysteine O-methyltransferase
MQQWAELLIEIVRLKGETSTTRPLSCRGESGVNPPIAANLALVLFALSEAVLRRGRTAKSVSPGKDDRGTSLQILLSYILAVLLLVAAGRFEGELWGLAWRWAGIAAAFVGLALRWWGMKSLGGFYTRTLTTVGDQKVVDTGPYRYIRHPGYLGSILTWLGASVALAPPVIVIVVAALLTAAYVRRIRAEEAMLATSLGSAYEAYSAKTWRLLPPVY